MSYVLPAPARRVDELTNRRVGDYQVGELLAVGEVTTLYRGLDPPVGREVAIKVLPLSSAATNPAHARRFRVEAQRMQTVRHPQVVPLEACGEVDGALYLVMPLYPASVRDHLTRYGPLFPPRAVQVALQVASALRGLHARGLVHRDVKPEHILLNECGDAYLAGLDAAREISDLQDPDVTWTRSSLGLPVGTPEYMAPEQVRGEPADQRVDVYGLGATLYELLTGRSLFVAETPWAVAALALQQPITSPSALAPHVWPTLERVLLQALAREACERYPDMASFEEALLHALGVMEVELYEEGWDEDVDMIEDMIGDATLPLPAPDLDAENRSVSSVMAPDPVSLPPVPCLITTPRTPFPGVLSWLRAACAVLAPLAMAAQGETRRLCRAMWVGTCRQLNQARASAMSARRRSQAAWRAVSILVARWWAC